MRSSEGNRAIGKRAGRTGIMIGTVGSLLVLAGLGAFFSTMRTDHCGGLTSTLRSFFPPQDYYEPIASVPVNLDQSAHEYRLTWTSKFTGSYCIGVMVEEPPPVGRQYHSVVAHSLRVYLGDREMQAYESLRADHPFWGGSRSPSGYCLVNYVVPEDLPLGEQVGLIMRVERSDPDFHQRYGHAALFVKKESDE